MKVREFDAGPAGTLEGYEWEAANPKGIVLIFHGMCEHAARYDAFARELARRGLLPLAFDYPGHGKSAALRGQPKYGHVEGADFRVYADSGRALIHSLGEGVRGLPLSVFGHSFGSFVGMDYLERHGGEVACAAFSGAGLQRGLLIALGGIISSLIGAFKGWDRPSLFLHGMGMGKYALSVEGAKTPFDWISANKENVISYIEDPACGFVCPPSFYKALSSGLGRVHSRKGLALVPRVVPILVSSGELDPVTENGRLSRLLVSELAQAGVESVDLKIFDGLRHEVLNEGLPSVADYYAEWLVAHL
jgi:alpha-beta hydrolase superfamily lysophospholipase